LDDPLQPGAISGDIVYGADFLGDPLGRREVYNLVQRSS
jgi:hypothetical protein